MNESTLKILSQAARNAAREVGLEEDFDQHSSIAGYTNPNATIQVKKKSGSTTAVGGKPNLPGLPAPAQEESTQPVSAASALAGMQSGTDAKSVLAELLASGDTLAYGAAKQEFDAMEAAKKEKQQKAAQNPYGGAQALQNALSIKAEALNRRAESIADFQAKLEKRIADFNAGRGTDTQEQLNREIAALTLRKDVYNRDLAAYEKEYAQMSGIILEGLQAVDAQIAKAQRAQEVYFSDAHGEMLDRQIQDAYERQAAQAAAERDGTSLPNSRSASELWDEYLAAEARYSQWETEKAEYSLSILSNAERQLLNRYVEAKNNQGLDYKGGYYGGEEVESRRKAVVDRFGKERAEQLIQMAERSYNAKRQQEENRKMAEYAQRGVGEAIVASVASIVTNALSAPGVLVSTLAQKLHNPNNLRTLDTNTAGFSMQNATLSFRGGVQSAIMPDEANATAGQKAGVMLYSTLMSALDSLVASRLPGNAGGVLLGATAATNTMQDVTERGGTMNQAITAGVVSGVFECLFEDVSIGKFKALQKKRNVRSAVVFLQNVGKSIGVNASEEAATELANILYDSVALGDVSNYAIRLRELMQEPDMDESTAKQKLAGELAMQVIESAVSGALMGGVFGVLGGTTAAVNTKRKDWLTNTLMLDGLIAKGLSYQGTEIFGIAAQMQERRNAGKLVPSEDIMALAEKIQNQISRQKAQGAGMAEATNARATEDMLGLSESVQKIAEELQKENGDATQFSIEVIDGRVMTVIDTKNDTRDFDAAESYLKTLIDTENPFATILSDAQPVYIGKDLPDEYRRSEHTKSMNPALRTVKMQAATNLDEMLLLAENGEWRENVKKKHQKDAANGWYRYDTEFAKPIQNTRGEIDHYNIYEGTLLIRNDADGKSYLYDLLDIIRKKTVAAPTSSTVKGRSEVSERAHSSTFERSNTAPSSDTAKTQSEFNESIRSSFDTTVPQNTPGVKPSIRNRNETDTQSALRAQAEETVRTVMESYPANVQEARVTAVAQSLRETGETALADEVIRVWQDAGGDNVVYYAKKAAENTAETEDTGYGREGEEGKTDSPSVGGGERDDGGRTGGSSGVLGTGAGSRQKRNVQGRRAVARQNRINALRTEKVSTKSRGIRNGSEIESITIAPYDSWDEEMHRTAEWVKEVSGLQVQYILGKLRVETSRGTRYAKGAITGDTIYIQADNMRYSVRQIAEHEVFHDIANGNRGLVSAIEEAILNRYSEAEYQKIVERYLEAYAGVYKDDEELLRKIATEIFADAYAGINEFSEQVPKYRETVTELVNRRTGRLGDRGTPETRAGPTSMQNAPANAEEFSIAGEKAETADREMLAEAQRMQADGADAAEIFRETGWYQGRDGKWRFEIDDSGMEITKKYLLLTDGEYLLRDIVSHDELFKAYPQLGDMKVKVSFLNMEQKGVAGLYDAKTDTIILNRAIYLPDNSILDLLVHEIQHKIQRIEGLSRGSSPEYWRKRGISEDEYNKFKNATQMKLEREMRSLGESERSDMRRYFELDKQVADALSNAAELSGKADFDGAAEILDRIDETEREHDELYKKLYGKDWFNRITDLQNQMDVSDNLYTVFYQNTAGEIEARDVTERRTLTSEERRQRMPNTGDENTVFAEDEVAYAMNAQETQSVKEQIVANQDVLNKMQPVAFIEDNGWKNMTVSQFREKIVKDLKRKGLSVDRQGFGKIELTEKELNTSLDYMQTDAETAAYQAIHQVLKRGIEIHDRNNHKSRGYGTTTFAAPVVINGKRGNMAVVVKQTGANRYKVHRILTPEGKAFVLPEMANAVSTSSGGFTEVAKTSGVVAPDIDTAPNKSIAESESSVNPRFAMSFYDAGSPAAEAEEIWQALRDTYGESAMLDGVANDRIQKLREQGETETADVLERLWRADPRSVAPPTGYDDRGERWDGTMRTIGETETQAPAEPNRFEKLRREAVAPREERLRLVTREEFSATPAIDKLGIRVEGSVADYGKAESLRRNDRAAKELRSDIDRAKKRMKATAAESSIASNIAAGVLTEDDIPATMNPDRIMELAELYGNERALGYDMIAERRRDINGALDEIMEDLFHDADRYRPSSAISLYNNTPQRNMRRIFGDQLGKRINQEIFDPVARNEAERIRFVNRQFDDMRVFADAKGRMRGLTKEESALVQQVIEGRAIAEQVASMEMGGAIRDAAEDIRNGGSLEDAAREHQLDTGDRQTAQRYARWLDAQEALKSGRVDEVKIENAVRAYQEKFADFYDAINDFLVVHGYAPIGFIKGYAPHMQSDDSKKALEKAFQAFGIQTGVDSLPTNLAGVTSNLKPGKRWNPYFLERTTDQTDFDIQSGFESYVNYMSDVLYHTDDIMRIRRMVNYFRKTYSRDDIRNRIEWAEGLRYAPIEEKEEYLREERKLSYGSSLTVNDVEQAMDDYITEQYGHIENLTKYGNMVSWLDNYANILAGKQSIADRGFEGEFGRKSLNIGLKLTRAFARAQVAGNLSSALNQTAQLPMILAENGTGNTLRAMGDIAFGRLRRAGFSEESDLLTGKRGIQFLVHTPGDMVTTAMFKPAEFVDGFVSTLAVRSAYLKSVRKGMNHADAMRAADQSATEIMASRLKGVKPTGFESKNVLSQVVHMFQVEAVNSWEHMIRDLPRDFREIAETKGRGKAALALAGVIVKALLAAFLLNRTSDELYGGTPAPFDLLGLTANFIASGNGLSTNDYLCTMIDNVWEEYAGERLFGTKRRDGENDFDWQSAGEDLFYNISNDVPFVRNVSGLMGWGDQTLPMPNVWGRGRAIAEAAAHSGFLSEEMGDAITGMASELVPGGRQLYKTTQGVKTMRKGGRTSGYGENERMQYPVDATAGNWIRAVLFGNAGLPETGSFYASGLSGLSKGQTAVYRALVQQGADGGEVYDTIQAMRAAETPRDKRDVLTAANLTDRQKAKLYSGVIGEGRDEDFTVLMQSGMGWSEIMDAYNRYAELEEQEDLSAPEKATEYARWLDAQNYTQKQKKLLGESFAFYSHIPAEAGQYAKMTDAGLSSSAAYELTKSLSELTPEEGKKQVSDLQRFRKIDESSLSEQDKLAAIGAIMGTELTNESGSPSQYAKMLAVLDEGASLSEYLDLQEIGRVDLYLEASEAGMSSQNAITLAETMDALEPEPGKEQVSDMQKYRAIDASGLNDEEKLNAMSVLLGMEMETESGEPSQRAKMLRVVETGASLTDYLDIKEAGGVDNYLEAVDLGLNREKAKEVVEAVAALPKLPKGEEYTSDQKKLAALSACDTAEEQIIVYATYGSSDDVITTTAKFTAAAKYDVTPEMYLKAKAFAKADFNKDNNNSLNSKEVEAALRSMDLTNRQRAALWQMFGIKWKKNPFGNTADIRTAYEKAVEEKKKQKD